MELVCSECHLEPDYGQDMCLLFVSAGSTEDHIKNTFGKFVGNMCMCLFHERALRELQSNG